MAEKMTKKEIEMSVYRQIFRAALSGLPIPVDPDDADGMGAFVDDALTLEDALASRFDDGLEGE